ncbi:MAG TPA: phospholipase [Ensifer sp.]|nr:phospholipase [Ensifer sp.]
MGHVSTVHLRLRTLVCLVAALIAPSVASALELKPFKDDLFAYPGILESKDNGDWIKVDYRKERDIYQRDTEPERKVKWQYVSMGVTWHQSFDTVDMGAGHKLDIFTAGKVGNQKFSVVFIHGRGVDRKLGASDERFGGNFNRLKNLAVDNGGVYVAPTVKSFDAAGAVDVSALIRSLSKTSGGNPVILACASMGTLICREVARDPQAVAVLSGMILMSGVLDSQFETTPFYTAHLPLFFTHGTDDTVYPWQDQDGLYRKLHDKGYPTRFVLFNTGSHGIPLRMLDWRDTLNWFFRRS